jgi:hypothetical protein
MSNWLFGMDNRGRADKSILEASINVMCETYVGSIDIIGDCVADMMTGIIIKHRVFNDGRDPVFYAKIWGREPLWFLYEAIKNTSAFRKYITVGPQHEER